MNHLPRLHPPPSSTLRQERRYDRAVRRGDKAADPWSRVGRFSGEGGSTTAYAALEG